jgi:hypothetical protein
MTGGEDPHSSQSQPRVGIRCLMTLRCCRGILNCICGATDYIDHDIEVGDHRNVT